MLIIKRPSNDEGYGGEKAHRCAEYPSVADEEGGGGTEEGMIVSSQSNSRVRGGGEEGARHYGVAARIGVRVAETGGAEDGGEGEEVGGCGEELGG